MLELTRQCKRKGATGYGRNELDDFAPIAVMDQDSLLTVARARCPLPVPRLHFASPKGWP